MGVYSRNNTTTGLTAIDVDLTKIANIIVIYQFVVKILLLVIIGISFSAATTFQYQSVLPCHIISYRQKFTCMAGIRLISF